MNAQASFKTIPTQDHAAAREMMRQMAFIRGMEAKALELTQTNPPRVPGSMHFCAGQEAVPVGAAAGLRPDDQMIATYRGHGWAYASGLSAEGVIGEICQKSAGINGGRGGSAYMMAPDTRFIGENSIVGAGTTIACGVAMANLRQNNGRVVTVTIGDGASNQGSVHEAMAFAAAFVLPVIFVIENNGWAELTPTKKMVTVNRIAERARSYSMRSATVNGVDPIEVRDSFSAAAEHCRSGKGPCLLEFHVPRLWGHYHKDIEHYRPKEDQASAKSRDPLVVFGERLRQSGTLTKGQVNALIETQAREASDITEEILTGDDPDVGTVLDHVQTPATAIEPKIIETVSLKYIEAVNLALQTELKTDPTTLLYGEDVGNAGGIFGGTKNLQRMFGEERVFDMPIAENAILGSAVGAALVGMKPIVEIMWADFIFVALDQLINQAANIRYITGGKSNCPMVVRTQQGVTAGSCAQHSQSIEAILAHIPGVKLALAASAEDAYALLRAAVADPDPVVVIEAREHYFDRGEVNVTDLAESIGKARLRREGSDLTIVTWGNVVARALEAAELLGKEGVQVNVLDLRWLNPIDDEALVAAVKATNGKVLVVHEAVQTGGFAGEIALRLNEMWDCPSQLKVSRLTTPDVRIPASATLQSQLVPNSKSIAAAARALLENV